MDKQPQVEYWKQKIISIKRKDQIVLFGLRSLGEVTCALLLLAEGSHRKKSIVIIDTTSGYWNPLMRFFPEARKLEMIEIPRKIYDALANDTNFLEKHGVRTLGDAMQKNTDSCKDFICRLFNLPLNTKHQRFPIHSPHQEWVKEYFRSECLIPGRTVFIVPISNFCGSEVVSRDYWVKLSAAIRRKGGRVFFNSKTPVVEGEPFGFLALEDLPDFIGLCGNVVGVRTGLMDFFAGFSDAKCIVIWPNQFDHVFICDFIAETARRVGFCTEGLSQKELLRALVDFIFHYYSVYALTGNESVIDFIHDVNEEAEIERIVAEFGF